MTENLNLALQLLIVGMSTVFLILGVVVGLGRFLIFIVNKYGSTSNSRESILAKSSHNSITSKKVAVLTAVVDHLTENRGTVSTIEKL